MKEIKFVIDGDPMGKQRPKMTFMGKSKFVHAYTPKETVNYESKVVYAFKDANKENVFFDANEELLCVIRAYFQIPKSHYKFYKKENQTRLDGEGQKMLNGKVRPTKKPDCDNIAKICLDALNGIAMHDDSQVIALTVFKLYSEKPRVEVLLRRVHNGNE